MITTASISQALIMCQGLYTFSPLILSDVLGGHVLVSPNSEEQNWSFKFIEFLLFHTLVEHNLGLAIRLSESLIWELRAQKILKGGCH